MPTPLHATPLQASSPRKPYQGVPSNLGSALQGPRLASWEGVLSALKRPWHPQAWCQPGLPPPGLWAWVPVATLHPYYPAPQEDLKPPAPPQEGETVQEEVDVAEEVGTGLPGHVMGQGGIPEGPPDLLQPTQGLWIGPSMNLCARGHRLSPLRVAIEGDGPGAVCIYV